MTNPLTTLDELIWRQFEKVTVAAEKRWGWDKWDLTKMAGSGTWVATLGAGVYGTIEGYFNNNSLSLGLGIANTLLAPAIRYLLNTYNRLSNRIESQTILLTGAVPEPQFNWYRPLTLYGAVPFTLGTGLIAVYLSTRLQSNQNSSVPNSSFLLLNGLICVAGAICFTSLVSASYFLSQLPRPPSTEKKSLWQALANYITKPFHKEPQPVEVPAAKYVAEQKALLADYLKSQA